MFEDTFSHGVVHLAENLDFYRFNRNHNFVDADYMYSHPAGDIVGQAVYLFSASCGLFLECRRAGTWENVRSDMGTRRRLKSARALHSLIRVSLVRMKKLNILGYPKWPSEDSDMSALMRRLIGIFVGRTCSKVQFLTLRLDCVPSADPN